MLGFQLTRQEEGYRNTDTAEVEGEEGRIDHAMEKVKPRNLNLKYASGGRGEEKKQATELWKEEGPQVKQRYILKKR